MAKSGIKESVVAVTLSCIPNAKALVVVKTLGEGNCFFHAILRGFNKAYIEAKTLDERRSLAREVRDALADSLEEEVAPGILYYDTLARGTLRAFAKAYPDVNLKAMQQQLRSNAPVDNVYHEMISDTLDKDIYFIDLCMGDIYVTSSDLDLLYKGRDSIFVVVSQPKRLADSETRQDPVGHFDILGRIDSSGNVQTYFAKDDPFTILIYNRLKARTQKVKTGFCVRLSFPVEDELLQYARLPLPPEAIPQ